MKRAHLVSLMITLTLSASCGRIIEDSEAEQGRRERDERGGAGDGPIIVPEDVIRSQRLLCEDVLTCPESINKLIIFDKDKKHQCIGNLIAPDKILTSASCLPKSLRIPNIDCSKSIFAVFAKSGVHPEEIVGCRNVEYVNNNLFKEAALWQSDLAIIKLGRSLSRNLASLSHQGVRDNEELKVWKVENQNSNIGVLKESECTSLLETYLNPLSNSPYSSMFIGAHCDLDVSDNGAPVYRDGDIVGVMSKEMGKRIYEFLIGSGRVEGELSRYYHFNNMSCFDELFTYIGTYAPSECFKKKTTRLLDQARGKILKSIDIHKEAMERAKEEIKAAGQFFNWKIDFKFNNRTQELHSYYDQPECIVETKSWIGQYRTWRGKIWTFANVKIEVPKFIFKVRLDEDLKALSYVDDSQVENYRIQFNPFDAHTKKKTYVTLLWDLDQQNPPSVTFDDVESECAL